MLASISALILVPALGRLFNLVPFPAPFLGWMLLAPLTIVLADDLRRLWLRRQHRGRTATSAPAGAPGRG
jgi:hypothetical protein